LPELVLASTSPRRSELLARLGIRFRVVPPDYEEIIDPRVPAADLAQALASGKARSISQPGSVVVGADTFIVVDDEYLGKPIDATDARRQLLRLSGTVHHIVTGVAIVATNGAVETLVSDSRIRMRKMSEEEIVRYVATREPLDKAGSYALQGMGSAFVERVEGDVTGIIGLPLAPLSSVLERHGFRLFSDH